jgi:hypothetical protein
MAKSIKCPNCGRRTNLTNFENPNDAECPYCNEALALPPMEHKVAAPSAKSIVAAPQVKAGANPPSTAAGVLGIIVLLVVAVCLLRFIVWLGIFNLIVCFVVVCLLLANGHGKIVAGLFVIWLCFSVLRSCSPNATIEGRTAKVQYDIDHMLLSASYEANEIAQLIYKTAKKYPNVDTVEVEVISTYGGTDEFGKPLPNPYYIGVISERDLSLVRNYVDADWFAVKFESKYREMLSGK